MDVEDSFYFNCILETHLLNNLLPELIKLQSDIIMQNDSALNICQKISSSSSAKWSEFFTECTLDQ